VGVNVKVSDGVKDAEHGDMKGAVRGGVYGENEGVESIVLEWDHDVFGGVLSVMLVESVFHVERGWVPDAAHLKRECGGPNESTNRVTYPTRLLMNSVCGTDEKIGLERLEFVGKRQIGRR